MARTSISLSEARRISLCAQGFGQPRPTVTANKAHIRRIIRKLGLLQLDFVNVLVPAHYMVVYSRLGPYDRDCFDRLVHQESEFTEHWAHEASIVPAELWPDLEYRRKSFRPYPNTAVMKFKHKSRYLRQLIEIISNNGRVTCSDLPRVDAPKSKPGDWQRGVPRSALEYHFGYGNLAIAGRLKNFQRVYDLPERVLDSKVLSKKVSKSEGQRNLIRIAADAYGIATAKDLADYFRMTVTEAQPRIDELAEEGLIQRVSVEGWEVPAYLAKSARIPRKISCATLLSPFDPVVWYRPRGERLFNFHYRIEIYVPAAKRRYGYYVLPFLLNDEIVGRVDLKADRKNKTLMVMASHYEPGVDVGKTAEMLCPELCSVASWLGLEHLSVSRRGNLAKTLAKAAKSHKISAGQLRS